MKKKVKAKASFPFLKLPLELQLLILRLILVSPAPIVNPGVPPGDQKIQVKGEEDGRHQINARTIFTCKLFYKEGLPLLYGCNTFIYSDFLALSFSYRLSRSLYKGCQQCLEGTSSLAPATLRTAHSPKHYRKRKSGSQRSSKGTSSPSTLRTAHSPKYYCNRNSALAGHATSIQLRLFAYGGFPVTDQFEELLLTLEDFPNLSSLHLDFWALAMGFHGNESLVWDDFFGYSQRACSIQQLEAAVQRSMIKSQDYPNRSAGGVLKEITLTGLPSDNFSLDIARQFARLLASDGWMGIGWGPMGERYDELSAAFFYNRSDELRPPNSRVPKRKDDDGEVLWMRVEEVGVWIEREYDAMSKEAWRTASASFAWAWRRMYLN